MTPHFEIARWIAAYLSKSLGSDEQMQLDRWRKASSAHEELFQRLCTEQHLLHYAEQLTTHIPITPGSSKALLILEDGSTLPLSATTDTLLTQATSITLRLDSAQLTYQHAALDAGTQSSEKSLTNAILYSSHWNSIQTPQGGEYRLTLSDGTRVYLNALSTLSFPVEFSSEQRIVELSGEAYFEVIHSGTPFIVRTPRMEVEVMGTAFNLSAYPDEVTSTTLVNGQVKVSASGVGSRLLVPSQQASLTPGEDRLCVKQVDTDCFTAWTKGKILFKDERLDVMMKQLSRWYDMEVNFAEPSLKALRFGCHLNRYHDITPFLRLLEQTGKVSIKVDGHRLTISTPSTTPTYRANSPIQ